MSVHVCFNCRHSKLVDGSFDGGIIRCQRTGELHYEEEWGCDAFEDKPVKAYRTPEFTPEPDYLLHCPICGAGDPQYVVRRKEDGEILGCNRCTEAQDSLDYYEEVEVNASNVHRVPGRGREPETRRVPVRRIVGGYATLHGGRVPHGRGGPAGLVPRE